MKIFLLLIIVSLPLTCYAKTIRTKSYVRKNGTYVNSANKTSPNKTKIDNYSTKGNVNPYTGKEGTKKSY